MQYDMMGGLQAAPVVRAPRAVSGSNLVLCYGCREPHPENMHIISGYVAGTKAKRADKELLFQPICSAECAPEARARAKREGASANG